MFIYLLTKRCQILMKYIFEKHFSTVETSEKDCQHSRSPPEALTLVGPKFKRILITFQWNNFSYNDCHLARHPQKTPSGLWTFSIDSWPGSVLMNNHSEMSPCNSPCKVFLIENSSRHRCVGKGPKGKGATLLSPHKQKSNKTRRVRPNK